MSKTRCVTVVLVDRANYGRMKPVMKAIQAEPGLNLQVVCAGTMLLERFGRAVQQVEADGFTVDAEVYVELEGSSPVTMTKSLGIAVTEFANVFQRIKPDVVLLIGDRYEAFGATIAASYMNLCIAHIQGGEVSGSIDESARHCMTKLAHYHFPSTRRAAEYIIRMGENPETVFWVGCPSGDIARNLDCRLSADFFHNRGAGCPIVDATQPYLLVVYHPVTTHYQEAAGEVQTLLSVLDTLRKPVVWLWPNIDAGGDTVSKTIRSFREKRQPEWLQMIKNFSPEDYLRVLANASCAIGNSSSFIRDSSFLGTPIVLLGERQQFRETAHNVRPVKALNAIGIQKVIEDQLAEGIYAPSTLYGDGHAARRIVSHLLALNPYVQKNLFYPLENDAVPIRLPELEGVGN